MNEDSTLRINSYVAIHSDTEKVSRRPVSAALTTYR